MMKSKKLAAVLLIVGMAVFCMTGCGEAAGEEQNAISTESVMEEIGVEESTKSAENEETAVKEVTLDSSAGETTYESSTDEAEKTIEESTETSKPAEEYAFEFEVYTDGEPHYVMFHEDAEQEYWETFTSISKPDSGIESVSFLSAFVDYEGEMRVFVDNKFYPGNDWDTPIDMTSWSVIADDGYAVLIPTIGFCGIIDSEFTFEGEIPTIDEVERFIKKNYGLSSYEELFAEVSEDGDLMYCSYCSYTFKDAYYGGYAFRVKDGKAQGAFIVMLGDDYFDGAGYLRYMMQSLRFTD